MSSPEGKPSSPRCKDRLLKECIFFQHSSIEQCAVVGKPDPDVGEAPVASWQLRSKAEAAPDDVVDPVDFQVVHYKQIGEVFFIDEIPVSPAGKVLKKDLRERLQEGK